MSSTISYPSRTIHVVNVPEVRNFRGAFQYNFFVPDEREMSADVSSGYASLASVTSLRGSIPRFVHITFAPSKIQDSVSELTSFEKFLTYENFAKIQSEDAFSNDNFSSVNVQNTGLDNSIYTTVSASLSFRGIELTSPSETAHALNALTSTSVSSESLIAALSPPGSSGITFVNEKTDEVKDSDPLKPLRNLVFHGQLGNRSIVGLVNSSAKNVYNMHSGDFDILQESAAKIQAETRANTSSTSVSYDVDFIPVAIEPAPRDCEVSSLSAMGIVGYIVDRYEMISGRVIKKDPILIVGQSSTSVIDSDVKYGAMYAYTVRSVAAVRIPTMTTAGLSVLATGLVSSKPSPKQIIHCIERVPPAPPSDFRFGWDHKKSQLRLIWSFPVTPQRDIKYFQIFRRASINEPFSLLKEYDFDDSTVRTKRSEIIPTRYIKLMIDNPSTVYVDEDFTKDTTCIYALASIDAHGHTSGYSEQFEVSFDRFKNRLVVRRISSSGAPKPLPNLYLPEHAFVDTMKTSGFDRMTIYFDPEYLEIVDNNNNDLGFLPVQDPKASYKIHTINTDIQESNIITILLKDLRT